MTDRQPPDLADRRRITTDLDATLFVEAGAGSGKTTALVSRVVALVTSGVPMRAIAAITFTEKAAAELRDRIRQRLEEVLAVGTGAPSPNPEVVERVARALADLDGAAVGTLHSFAQRILGEHPVEAGLPPRIDVLDEIESELEFDDRWLEMQERLLADPDLARTVRVADALKIRLDHLRAVARQLQDNWDLLEQHPPPEAGPPPLPSWRQWAEDLLALCDERRFAPDGCLLGLALSEAAAQAERVRDAADEVEALEVAAAIKIDRRKGNAKSWGTTYRGGRFADLAGLKAALADALDERDQRIRRVTEGCLAHLLHELATFTLDGATARREGGRLVFHDLLVLARRLMRHPHHGARVRAALRSRYQRLLLDEFQDTDPIQLELAVLIAADPAAEPRGDLPWPDYPVEPGRLFFVGDPKQSIYRFRRADIATFLSAQERFGPPVTLSANFRTVHPVVDWVNTVFDRLIEFTPGSQPHYVPLSATRTPAEPRRPSVHLLGVAPHPPAANGKKLTADELRRREADEVAAAVATMLAEGWLVADPDAPEEAWRPVRLGDIAVLLPTRAALPFLEEALDARGLAYRAESSSLVYGTAEVRDLLLALRAADDPSDALAVAEALRSPVFGCSDADLVAWHLERGGSWNHQAPLPPPLPGDDPVHDAMTLLADLHRARSWATPSQLLERLVAERRLFELGFATGRARDVWRRLRFVIDQARAWSDAGGTGLRRYLAWARRQADEAARVAEVVLPETDHDALRILTVHAAKGLEFPVAVVAGLSTRPRSARGVQVVWPPGQPPGVKIGADRHDERFEAFAPVDEQMGFHERLRLLYVACTRARDHLVVSLHRTGDVEALDPKATNAEVLALAARDAGAAPLVPSAEPPPAPEEPPAPWAWADPDAWRAERHRVLAAARRTTTVSATGLAVGGVELPDLEPDDPGLAKAPVDVDLPPWLRGRYGTAIGRAVHAVLQTVDLATGAGVDDAARAQAAAEGVTGREALVAALARSALAAPVVQEAARAPHWREVYVGAPVGGRILEGYVDLLFRRADGLVVVDHKTDHVPDDDAVQARLARYRLQGAAYAVAVEQATGEPVVEVVFVFCRPDGPAVVASLPDLDAATAEVTSRVAATTGGG